MVEEKPEQYVIISADKLSLKNLKKIEVKPSTVKLIIEEVGEG